MPPSRCSAITSTCRAGRRRPRSEALPPRDAVARQDLAHGVDEPALGNGKLRGPGLPPFLIRGDRGGGLGALDQILDLHLAPRLLVAALDDHAGTAAPIGIFHLRTHFSAAEIELGADAGFAQLL